LLETLYLKYLELLLPVELIKIVNKTTTDIKIVKKILSGRGV
jgi:hypothetical protein